MIRKTIWPVIAVAGIAAARGGESPGPLQASLTKNVGHARDWLEQRDFKSLGQTAGGMQLLAELTKAKSDDAAWQQAQGNVLAKIGELQTAARADDAARCKSAIDALDASLAAATAIQPSGQAQGLPKPPAIRSLMLVMDAVQGDAKVAMITGNVESAKKQAHVLAELAKLVSNSRSGEPWSKLAGEFAAATTAAANTNDSDPKLVRQHFRAIAERCEACHENVRTQ